MPQAITADLRALLDRLKTEQHVLIDDAIEASGLPHEARLQEISVLENAIAAVEALIEERRAG